MSEAGRRAEELFLELADLGPKTRAGILEERCANEPALRAEVEALLGCHDGAGAFLEEPPSQTLGDFGRLTSDSRTLPQGAKIGSFTIERVLGEGGMGVVYVARQERPSRTVALKVIRRGYATASLLKRFEHEAEVLGRLQHPGIAQIFEAGSAPVVGQEARGEHPYIAMELVDGQPLTKAATSLDTRGRMELVAKVCEAVHHAHQRGIIHRDLKPANILVDSRGQPKVLDFGVARASDSDLRVTTMQTGIGQLIGTLPYMSPEQVLADPNEVDTRSDVYALGVILYQVLTGKLPLDLSSRSIPEAARLIRDEEPSRLSSLSPVFRGDIDTIVGKAMEKDKARRYQSAAELGADIERHLRGEAIAAKQDSALYVLRTQLRRYRGAAAAGAAIVLLLVWFSIYAGIQSQRNRHLADRLAEELSAANIERGRLMGVGGNLLGAEDMIWPELLAHPESKVAMWSLRELYAANPFLTTVAGCEYRYVPPAVSPDGRFVVLARADGVLEFRTPRLLTPIGQTEPVAGVVTALALSPDGSRVVVGTDEGALVWFDTATRAKLRAHSMIRGGIIDAAFSPDGSAVAFACADKSIVLMDPSSGQQLASLTGANDRVMSLAFMSSGKVLAASTRGTALQFWDIGNTRVARTIVLPSIPSAIAPVGDHELAVALTERVGVYDVRGGVAPRFLATESTNIRSMSVDPDGRRLLIAGAGSLEIWDIAAGKRLGTLGADWPGSFVGAAVFTGPEAGEGVCVTIGGAAAEARSWEMVPRALERSWPAGPGWVVGGVFTSGALVTTASMPSGEVAVWDPSTGARVRTLITTKQPLRGGVLSPDGKCVAVAAGDEGIRVLDIQSGEARAFAAPASRSVAFTGDGRFLVGGGTGGLAVWSLQGPAGEPLRTLRPESGDFMNMAGRPGSSQVVAVGGKPGVMVFDAATGAVVAKCDGLVQGIHAAYSDDGALLAIPGPGRSLEIRDADTLELRTRLTGNRDFLIRSDFSPDRSLIATGSIDGTVRLWETLTGRLLATVLACKSQVSALDFSQGGDRLLVSGQDRQIRVLDLTHYDQHVAGNLAYQKQRQGERSGTRIESRKLDEWAKGVLARPGKSP